MKANLVWANPTSGRGRGSKILAETLDYLDKQRVRYHVIATSSLDSAIQEFQEKSLSDFERLFIIGGDGLVHHALNELARKATADTPVGVIPAGTGNDFARTLGLDVKNPLRNIDLFLSSDPELIDLGQVNGRRFGAICSTGFDSLVNERANSMTWPRGKRKYDIAMLQELPRFKARNYQITIDGEVLKVQAMLIAVGNGSSYGGGMQVCPDANIRDGLLDIMVLHPVSKFEFVRIFPKVYSGLHITHPEVEIFRGKSVLIEGDAVTYADGERISQTPADISALPLALRTWTREAK